MNLKKNWIKHLLMVPILAIFGFLTVGSMDSNSVKGLKLYKEQKYEKAKKVWLNDDDVKTPSITKADSIAACWYLGEIFEKEGNEDKALNYKIKAYNETVKWIGNPWFSTFQEKYPGLYETMVDDNLIYKAKQKQEEERLAQEAENLKHNITGKWKVFSCKYDEKEYAMSNLRSYPKSIELNENGSGTIYWEMAKDVNFNWTIDGNRVIFSGTSLKLGYNNQGYIVCITPAIKHNLGIIYADFFFNK